MMPHEIIGPDQSIEQVRVFSFLIGLAIALVTVAIINKLRAKNP